MAGVFEIREEDFEGEPYWVTIVERVTPPHHVTYRLRWRLPLRKNYGVP